jgi:hypothetical protein
MKKYKLMDDGSVMDAATPKELVSQLKNSSRFASDETLSEYMKGFQKRFLETTGHKVRVKSYEWFVEDLIQFGFLQAL